MPVLFKNQSVLLKDFFNQQEDEPLKGISHKNILIKKNIIAYMALNGESTLADLARELHVSVPTITKLVGELVEENIVVDNGKIETAGGRRPNIFGLANTAIYFAGIDIGRDNVRYVVTDLKNNVIVSEEERDFVLSDNEQSLEEICRRINRFIDGCRIERCKILGMGVCIAGRVNPKTGRSYMYFTSSPESLKDIIEHATGIRVLLDVVHSHAVRNTAEGINMFDGTTWQFFHDGPKGDHPAWGTKCFDYGKTGVIHFLLSNLKFWMTEYHFDGFRFDGVTSMLYHDHALGTDFTSDGKYFSYNTDTEAVTYLQLANELIRQVNPKAITIAEDMSGMPGMCLPIADGGIGFDYRLGMGLPDMWIKAVKGQDEFWDINQMWGSMCLRRPGEKTVAYVESHDQALVGDQTMIFRLAGANMYTDMNKDCHNPVIDRAIALHKMIRLFTLSGGGEAYLNFMGNEFGHPEWIDFPREGNGWSFHYCRRQWSLKDNGMLKYQWLGDFDEDMVRLTKENRIFDQRMADLLLMKAPEQTLAYYRHGLVFVFNFHFGNSLNNVLVPVRQPGEYTVVLSTDDEKYGGFGNVAKKTYATKRFDGRDYIELYIPARTGFMLKEKVILPETPAAPKKAAK